MKAYHVYDRKGYSWYSIVVFAESPGKAKALALGTDAFPSGDWDFTELSARRMPMLDKYYRGHWEMDWYNDDDRLALIKDGGYQCDDDSFDPDECEKCIGKDCCGKYKEYIEENCDHDTEVR